MNFAGQIPHGNCGLRALAMALPKGGMLVLSDEFDVLAKNPMTPAAAAEGSPLRLWCLFFKWLNRISLSAKEASQRLHLKRSNGLSCLPLETVDWVEVLRLEDEEEEDEVVSMQSSSEDPTDEPTEFFLDAE